MRISVLLVYFLIHSFYGHAGIYMNTKGEIKATEPISFEYVNGLILIKATVDGHVGNYILDTGASELILNKKIDKADMILWMIGQELPGEIINIGQFEYGQHKKENFAAWATDLSFLEQKLDRDIGGIIGAEILKDHRIFLDYEKSSISIQDIGDVDMNIDPSLYHISTINFEHTTGNLPIINVLVGEHYKNLAFDTGAAISVINRQRFVRDDLHEQQTEKVTINQVNIQDVPFLTIPVDELNLNGHIKIDGILSVSSLNCSKVIIDYESFRIHILWSK